MSDKYIFDTTDPKGEQPQWPSLLVWFGVGVGILGFLHLPEILEVAYLVHWNIITLTAQ